MNSRKPDDLEIMCGIWLFIILISAIIAAVSLGIEELKTIGWTEDWSLVLFGAILGMLWGGIVAPLVTMAISGSEGENE